MIDTCDAVAFLPDFRRSAGALLEYDYCCYIDKSIRYFEDDVVGNTQLLDSTASELTSPLATPIMRDPADEIKKALEKDLHEKLYLNFMRGAGK
jgi:hypothetical protein